MAKARKGQIQKQKSQKKEWIPVEWQIVLLFMVLGVVLLGLGLGFRNSGPESSRWPMVNGEIKDVQVLPVEVAEGTAEAEEMYKLVITYSYAVKGVTYTADRYGLDSDFTSPSRSALEDRLATLKAGQKISVYYNPEYPETAVLDPGQNSSEWFLMGAAIVGGMGVCALALIVALRKKAKEQAKFKPSYTFKK